MYEGISDIGKRVVADVAARHGLPEDAVVHMLNALAIGGGTQAQFNHPALGGMGQWSMGGMTMVGDMFNNGLKAQVDNLCSDLAAQMQGAELFTRKVQTGGSSQSQWQGGAGGPSFSTMGGLADWPEALGHPASTGAQNDMRYAWFPDTHRLALSVNGRMRVFDTGDHAISGFGQAQSGGQSVTFTSQYGVVQLSALREVDVPGAEVEPHDHAEPSDPAPSWPAPEMSAPVDDTPPPAPSVSMPSRYEPAAPQPVPMDDDQIFSRIERLAGLHEKGILTDAEFEAKKAELLARL